MSTRDSTARRIQPEHEHIVQELAALPESDRHAIVEAADEVARRRARGEAADDEVPSRSRAVASWETIESLTGLVHVLPQALELAPDARTRLAVLLLESIEASAQDDDVESAWLDEITRRLDKYEKGTVDATRAESVFTEALNRVRRARD